MTLTPRSRSLRSRLRGDPVIPTPRRIDLSLDAVALTETLCNIESVSQHEQPIADAIEEALRGLDHLR